MLELFRNYKLKVLALLLGTFTWIIVNHQIITHEENFKLPVDITVSEGMIVVNKSLNFLRVQVRGPRAEIERFDSKAAPVVIDLSTETSLKTIKTPLDRTRIQKSISPDLKIIDYYPREMEITVDRKDVKTLPVEVAATGKPQFGYMLAGVSSSPRFFKYEAAASALENISAISTEQIDISGENGLFERKVNLVDPLSGRPLEHQVMVVIDVRPQYGRRAFESVPVKIMVRPPMICAAVM